MQQLRSPIEMRTVIHTKEEAGRIPSLFFPYSRSLSIKRFAGFDDGLVTESQ